MLRSNYTVPTSDGQDLLRDGCALISQTAVLPYTPMKNNIGSGSLHTSFLVKETHLGTMLHDSPEIGLSRLWIRGIA